MKKKKLDLTLIILSVFLCASFLFLEGKKSIVADNWKQEKIQAALLMEKSMEVLKEERQKLGIPIDDKIDINQTGLIGKELTEITTTLGSLEAKRSSTNPNFAAAVVDMLKELGIKKGDKIAINFSGSFPALNIAVLSAVETLDLNPVIISSIGASSYGANIPEFVYLDMEHILYQNGILKHRSDAFSIGGAGDVGRDMDNAVLGDILERVEKYNIPMICQLNFENNMEERIKLYFNNETPPKVLVNVGGNIISMGTKGSQYTLHGIIKPNTSLEQGANGLVAHFLKRGIPVINLLNIKKLSFDYGLPFDPVPMDKIGEGSIYHKTKYPVLFVVFSLTISITILIYYYKTKVRCDYDS